MRYQGEDGSALPASHDRHAHGRIRFVQAKSVCSPPAADRRCTSITPLGRQERGDGLAPGLPCATWMVQFHPTGSGGGTHAHDRHRAEEGRAARAAICSMAGRAPWQLRRQLERATRDIVSRAIYAEMRAGRTTPNGGVYTAWRIWAPIRGPGFKGMVERCRRGFDLAGAGEVVPTAHYMMGGCIQADCSTALAGLFAAGEDTAACTGQPFGRQRRANHVYGGSGKWRLGEGARRTARADREMAARRLPRAAGRPAGT